MKKKYNSVIFLPETEVRYRLWVSPSIAQAACGTSVTYIKAESRVRSTALSGLTHVRISGRALYIFVLMGTEINKMNCYHLFLNECARIVRP